MEDYQAAFYERRFDVEALCTRHRYLAAMHFGGVVVECLLKMKILAALPSSQKKWATEDSNPGHGIKNPGHSYETALGHLNRLRSYLYQNKNIHLRKKLERVEFPGIFYIDENLTQKEGSFISIRYFGAELEPETFKNWYEAYSTILRELESFK